jgi:hypothetical protein
MLRELDLENAQWNVTPKGYPSELGSARGCGTSLRMHVEALTGPASLPRLGTK